MFNQTFLQQYIIRGMHLLTFLEFKSMDGKKHPTSKVIQKSSNKDVMTLTWCGTNFWGGKKCFSKMEKYFQMDQEIRIWNEFMRMKTHFHMEPKESTRMTLKVSQIFGTKFGVLSFLQIQPL
jgi:hypothetical protein